MSRRFIVGCLIGLGVIGAWASGARAEFALDFDGDDAVTIPHSPGPLTQMIGQSCTVRAWVYLRSVSPGSMRVIYAKNGHYYARKFAIGVDANQKLVFYYRNDEAYYVTSTISVPLNQWTHIQVSDDPAAYNFYFFVDGVMDVVHQVGADWVWGNAWTVDGDAHIGYGIGLWPDLPGWDGMIDELELSFGIRDTANFTPSTLPLTPDSSTVALWHLDEGSGTLAADASSNGYNGTLEPDPLDPDWVTGVVFMPTATPTDTPTDTPTATPTDTPTATPTDTPTATPTDSPTDTPTATPTATPTDTPTDTPSITPTATKTTNQLAAQQAYWRELP